MLESLFLINLSNKWLNSKFKWHEQVWNQFQLTLLAGETGVGLWVLIGCVLQEDTHLRGIWDENGGHVSWRNMSGLG